MTDQAFDSTSVSSSPGARVFVPRALEPTAAFWAAMLVASALGTNIGDFWAESLGLGLQTSFASLAVICALMVWGDRENGTRTDAFYWLAIVCLRAVATNVGDFFTHVLGMNYLLAAVVLGALTLVIGSYTRPAAGGASPRIDLRYWAAMFVGGVFGTIGGDLVSHTIGLFLAAVLLVVLLIMTVRMRNLTAPTALVGYWCVVLAERAAGTPVGDWLAGSRGLNLSLPVSIVLTAAVLLVALSLQGTRTATSPIGLGPAVRVVLPVLRLALLVLSGLGCLFMLRIYVVQRPADPSLVLCYGLGLAVNTLYLGGQELAFLGSSRAMRLISLWFAAKRREVDQWAQGREAELRLRASGQRFAAVDPGPARGERSDVAQ